MLYAACKVIHAGAAHLAIRLRWRSIASSCNLHAVHAHVHSCVICLSQIAGLDACCNYASAALWKTLRQEVQGEFAWKCLCSPSPWYNNSIMFTCRSWFVTSCNISIPCSIYQNQCECTIWVTCLCFFCKALTTI
jgi:hypothetical protein